jgi:hypothetical protein
MAREAILSTPDALKIARALVRVPEQERIILQTLYVPQRMPAHRILQIRRVPPRICQERHLAGVRMFANILRTMQQHLDTSPAKQICDNRAQRTP